MQTFPDTQTFTMQISTATPPTQQATGLSIAGLNLSTTTPVQGSTVAVSFTLICTGQGGTYDINGAFGAPGNNDVVNLTQANGTIETGQSIPIKLTSGAIPYWQNVPVAQQYPHTLTAQINDYQQAFYTPSAVITLPGKPQPAGQPKVVVSGASCYILFSATEATDIEATWTYTNQGTAAATNVTFQVVYHTSIGDKVQQGGGVASLAPGESQPGRAVLNTYPTPGVSCSGVTVTVTNQ